MALIRKISDSVVIIIVTIIMEVGLQAGLSQYYFSVTLNLLFSTSAGIIAQLRRYSVAETAFSLSIRTTRSELACYSSKPPHYWIINREVQIWLLLTAAGR
jgi:hypothetical protein